MSDSINCLWLSFFQESGVWINQWLLFFEGWNYSKPYPNENIIQLLSIYDSEDDMRFIA